MAVQHGQGGTPEDCFLRLGDEELIQILRRVSLDIGKEAIHCLEVCTRWEKLGRWYIAKLGLRHTRTRHFIPLLSKFDRLTHLTLEKCDVEEQGWSELSQRCRDMLEIHIRLTNMDESNITTLLTGCGSSLKHLEISNSFIGGVLPALDSMTSLVNLDLSDNNWLQFLPSLRSLTNLTTLSLKGCLCLQSAPGLESLTQLRNLNLEGCLSLNALPHLQLLCHMSLLSTLSVSSKSINLPLEPGDTLDHFGFTNRNDAEILPQFPPLPNLHQFSFSYSRAEDLPDFSNLTGPICSVTILQFTGLTTITPLMQFHMLQRLELVMCYSIDDIQPLEVLTNLEDLTVSNCGVQEMDFTSSLTKLTSIKVESCEEFHSITLPEALSKLRRLSLTGNFELSEINSLSMHARLYELEIDTYLDLKYEEVLAPISKMSDLKFLNLSVWADFGSSPSHLVLPRTLEKLYLYGFPYSYTVSDLPHVQSLMLLAMEGVHCPGWLSTANLSSLVSVEIDDCRELTTAVTLVSISTLTSISIANCPSLVSLPDLTQLSCLRSLRFDNCPAITEFPVLQGLLQLTRLDIDDCSGFEHFPPVNGLLQLSSLRFRRSTSLATISSLDDLPCLRTIDLSGCSTLQTLPNLTSLPQLHDLNLSDCLALKKLPPLTMLTALESINVSGCHALVRLPTLIGLPWLREVHATRRLTTGRVFVTRHRPGMHG